MGTLRVSSAFTRTVAAPVLTTLRSARIRNGQPAPLAREPKCLLEPTCCRSGCSPDPGAPGERPPCPVNGGRPAALAAALVHNVRMPPSTKIHMESLDVTSQHTKHSIICDPIDGQEHSKRGRRRAGRGWLWSIPARSRAQDSPSANNARRQIGSRSRHAQARSALVHMVPPIRRQTASLVMTGGYASSAGSIISQHKDRPLSLKKRVRFVSHVYHDRSFTLSPFFSFNLNLKASLPPTAEVRGDRRPSHVQVA